MAQIFNTVEITKGGKTTTLTQPITTNNNISKIISVKNDSGTELFKVERQTNGDIKLSFDKSASFVDANGAAIAPPHRSYTIKAANANDVLKFCEHKNPDGTFTAGQELEFQVNSSVKIKANARGIELEDGGTQYFCNAAAGKSLGMNISNNAIHDWLEGTNGFEKATDIKANFPLPVLGVFIQDRIYSHAAPYSVTIGNFHFETLPNPNNATDPYVFIKNKKKTCLYANGQLKKVTEFISLHDTKTNKDFFAVLNGTSTYFQVDTNNATAGASEATLRGLGINNVTDMTKATTTISGVAFEDADSRKTKTVNFTASSATFKISEDPVDSKIGDILLMINIFKEQITVIINNAGEKADENLQKILIKLGEHEDLLNKILKQTQQNGEDIKKINDAVVLLGTALDKILENQEKLEVIVTGIDEQVKANSEELKTHGLKIDEILGIVKGLEGIPGKLGEIEKTLIESIKSNDDNFKEVFKQLTSLKDNQAEMRKTLDEILQKLSAIDTLSEDMKKLVESLNQFRTEVNQRFDKIEKRIDNLEQTFKTELEGVNKRLDKLDENQVKIYNILTQMGINVETLVTKTGELNLSVENIEKVLTTLSNNFEAYAKRTDQRFEQLLEAIGLNTEAINETRKLVEIGAQHIVAIDGKIDVIAAGQHRTDAKIDAVGDKVTHLENTVADLLSTVIFMMANPTEIPGATINNTTINNTTNNSTDNSINIVNICDTTINKITQCQQNLTMLTASNKATIVQNEISLINQAFNFITTQINEIKKDETKTPDIMVDIKTLLQEIDQHFNNLKSSNVLNPLTVTLIEKQITNVTNIITNIEVSYNKKLADEAEAKKKTEEEAAKAALPDNALTQGFDIQAFSQKTLTQMLEDYYAFFNNMIADEGASKFHIVNHLTKKARQKILDIKKAIALQQKNLKKLYVQLGKYNDSPSEDIKKEILMLIRELRLNQQVMRDYKDELKNLKFFEDEKFEDKEIKKQMGQMSDAIDQKTDKVLEKAEDMQKEKEEEKEEKGPEEVPHEHKKTVEYLSNALFPLSAVFIALACLTPLGIFALIPGIALAGACVLGNVYADKFNYKTWKYAHEQLTEQEQQELEDKEQLDKFMEKQAELEKMEEKIHILAHGGEVEVVDENGKVQKVRQDGLQQSFDDPSLEPLMKAYDQYGIGFNATPKADKTDRSNQLLGVEGHSIRKGMHEQLAIITNYDAPEAERAAAANKFIDENFGPEIKPEERQEVYKLLMSDKKEDRDALQLMTTRMGYLNGEEEQYLALLSETKVDISKMPDYLIAKALGSPELDKGDRRKRFIKRYGPTLVRRYAINDGLSQSKLTMLFADVPESVKPQCVDQMLQIAEEVFHGIEALEKFAEDSANRHKEIKRIIRIGYEFDGIANGGPVATRGEVYKALSNYLIIQSYKTTNSEATQAETDLFNIPTKTGIPNGNAQAMAEWIRENAVPDKGTMKNYKEVFSIANKLGIIRAIAAQRSVMSNPADANGLSKDERLFNLIVEHVRHHAADYPKREIDQLKSAIGYVNAELDNPKGNKITTNCLDKFSKQLRYPNGVSTNQVDQEFKKIKTERKNSGKKAPFSDRFGYIVSDDSLRRAIYCELYIQSQMKDDRNALAKIFNMILSGQVAEMGRMKGESTACAEALGIDRSQDINEEATKATTNANQMIDAKNRLESVLNLFPASERSALLKQMVEHHNKELKTNPNAELKDSLIFAIKAKYGKQIVNFSTNETLAQLIDRCTIGGSFKFEIFEVELVKAEEVLKTHDEKELSCCELMLGKRLTHDIYDEVVNESGLDAANNENLSQEILDQERKEEMTLNMMMSLRDEFEVCWNKARNAKTEQDLEPLIKLLRRPAAPSQLQVYEKKLDLLRKLGIEVDKIIQDLNSAEARLAAATTDDEKAKIIQATAGSFQNQERMYGYILTSKEAVAKQLRDFNDMKMMHRARNENDRDMIDALRKAETAVDEATTISAKLRMIHSLKAAGKLSENEFRTILENFALGRFDQIISPHLKGLRFSRNDPAILAKIGITPANIVDLTMDEITDKVKKYIEEQSAEYKRASEIASGKTEPKQEKQDGEIHTAPNTKGIKHNVSLITRIFGNIKESDRLTREKRAELERLGLTKTATTDLEAEAGEHTLEDEVKEGSNEVEAGE